MNPITYVLTDTSAVSNPSAEVPQPLLGLKNPAGAGAYLATVLSVNGAAGAQVLETVTDAIVVGGESPSTRRLIPVMCRLTGYNVVNDEFLALGVQFNDDAIDLSSDPLLSVAAAPYLFNGTTSDKARAASADNVGNTSGTGAQLVACPGEWSENEIAAAGALASVTRAGSAGIRQICRSITVSITCVNVQGAVNAVLRDGAAGVGAILWSCGFVGAAGTCDRVAITGLNIAGTAGNDMTLEFSGAPAAGNAEQVTLTGYDAV